MATHKYEYLSTFGKCLENYLTDKHKEFIKEHPKAEGNMITYYTMFENSVRKDLKDNDFHEGEIYEIVNHPLVAVEQKTQLKFIAFELDRIKPFKSIEDLKEKADSGIYKAVFDTADMGYIEDIFYWSRNTDREEEIER